MPRRRITSANRDAGVVRQNFGQFIPAVFRLELEHLEVYGRYAGRVFFKQFVHSFGEFVLVQRFRQFIDNAVAVMGDAQGIQERNQHVLVFAQQPDLKQMVTDFIAGFPRQHFLDEGKLFLKRFALDKFGAQFFQGSKFTHGGAVNGAFLVAHPVQNVADCFFVRLLENVICLHDK